MFCVIIDCLSVKVYDKVRVLMFHLDFKCWNAMRYTTRYYTVHIPLYVCVCMCVCVCVCVGGMGGGWFFRSIALPIIKVVCAGVLCLCPKVILWCCISSAQVTQCHENMFDMCICMNGFHARVLTIVNSPLIVSWFIFIIRISCINSSLLFAVSGYSWWIFRTLQHVSTLWCTTFSWGNNMCSLKN